MAESGESPPRLDELGPVDYLMHREANPRTRSGIMALELLIGTPDWDRFHPIRGKRPRRVLRAAAEGGAPSGADRGPALGGGSRSIWTSMCVGCKRGPATLREVLDLAEGLLQSRRWRTALAVDGHPGKWHG